MLKPDILNPSVHGLIHAWTILWISMHGQLSIEAHGQLSMHGQLLSMHGQLSIELYGQLSMLWTIVHSYGQLSIDPKIVHILSILWTIYGQFFGLCP